MFFDHFNRLVGAFCFSHTFYTHIFFSVDQFNIIAFMQDILLIDHREYAVVICVAFFNVDQLHIRMQSLPHGEST